jgi:uncharacterized protein with FMN-binding domain
MDARTIPAVAALASLVAGCGSSSTPKTAATTTQPRTTSTAAKPKAKAKATPAGGKRTVAGPSVPMRWGPVQVTVTLRGRRISEVTAGFPIERPRSAEINLQAGPLLRQEVLQAQSARIHVISGATLSSEAYATSLSAALAQARG